jgi:hypothetical protein
MGKTEGSDSMKVILQERATELYFQGEGQWVKDASEAFNFGNSLEAIDYCVTRQISGVEIVLKFADPRYDIRLAPFAPELSATASSTPDP